MRGLRTYSSGVSAVALSLILAVPALAQESTDRPARSDAADAKDSKDDIIVTGVLSARSIENAPLAITAVDSETLEQQGATTASDILRNVPGVYVDSSSGQFRSVVFSRGVSASTDLTAGYYYVSMQEDGLPVEPLSSPNFGPDYFVRPDIMLGRVEALRGGPAVITGPNAPGGIFNYILKNGRSDPGTEVRLTFGLEGNGSNPSYRADLYSGGELAPNLYYAIGGFYRRARGARDLGYDFERGGQVRANLLWDYGSGSLSVGAKYLNDHNGFWGDLPGVNLNDPKIAPGFDNSSTNLLDKSAAYSFVDRFGETRHYNPADLVHNRSLAFNAQWKQDLSDNVQLVNNTRWSHNRSDWNSLALGAHMPVNDFIYNFLAGNLLGPGTFTFRNSDGSVAARMREDFIDLGGGNFFPNLTVTENNLPNQHLSTNAIMPGFAYLPSFSSRHFQNQTTLTAKISNHTISVGGYVSVGSLKYNLEDAGMQFATYTTNPDRLNITYVSDFIPGTTFQVTNPQGWAHRGVFGGDRQFSNQTNFAAFVGDTWAVTDRLTLEAGLRYEKLNIKIVNDTGTGSTSLLGPGGADGNPLTLYDNGGATFAGQTTTRRSFSFVNYTLMAAYDFTSNFNAYVRYTDGKKAPDLNIISGIDTPEEIATLFPKPQRIQQLEAGLKYRSGGINLQVFPFYSRLSNVAAGQQFFDDTGQAYSPPPVFGTITTFGAEIQGLFELSNQLTFNTAITLQRARASGFGSYLEVTQSRLDDLLVELPAGKAPNNPDIMTRSTLTFRPVESLKIFVTHSYLGARPANKRNAFNLPGFHTVDMGATWNASARFSLQLNVNNVFNNYGIMGWSRAGGFVPDAEALTPDDIAADPNRPFTVNTTQPRSFVLTASAKF